MRILSVTLFAFVLAACASSTTGSAPTGAPDPGVSQPADDASGVTDDASGAGGDDQASGTEADADQPPQDQNPHIAGDMAASARVTDIELSPSPIALTRGETIRVEGRLTDADGNRVTGVKVGNRRGRTGRDRIDQGQHPGQLSVSGGQPGLHRDLHRSPEADGGGCRSGRASRASMSS